MENEPQNGQTPHAISSTAFPAPAVFEGAPYLSSDEGWKQIQDLALRQLHRFMSCAPKVLKGDDPDAVHDMRVASRRLQQVLDLLYPKPRPQEYRKLRRQIRSCRRVLGEVRNYDVLVEHIQRSLRRKRAARRDAWTAVERYLSEQRSGAFRRTVRKLGKINLAVFYVSLKDMLHRPKGPAHADDHHHGAAAHLPELSSRLKQAIQPVWTAFVDEIAHSLQDTRPAVVHGARIATKRLRYLLEVLHELGVEGSAEALAWLHQLQNHLGNWHDLEVLEQMMIEMIARPDFLREQLPLAMTIEKLILRNRENKVGFEEKYFRISRDSGEMGRLQSWISYLLASPSEVLAGPW